MPALCTNENQFSESQAATAPIRPVYHGPYIGMKPHSRSFRNVAASRNQELSRDANDSLLGAAP